MALEVHLAPHPALALKQAAWQDELGRLPAITRATSCNLEMVCAAILLLNTLPRSGCRSRPMSPCSSPAADHSLNIALLLLEDLDPLGAPEVEQVLVIGCLSRVRGDVIVQFQHKGLEAHDTLPLVPIQQERKTQRESFTLQP